jgi:isopentenyldiphosphate isomerase
MEKNETFDLVDEKGNVTGNASREECHSSIELIHPTVHFTLFNPNSNEILLTKRSYNKRWDPGKTIFLGEHMVSGETYEDGLLRGVAEELGFVPTEYKILGDTLFKQESQTEYTRFFLVFYHGELIDFDRAETEEIWWVGIDELKNYDDSFGAMTQYWIDNIDWSTLE